MAEVVIKIRAEDKASGALGTIKAALGNIGQIAAGILSANLLRGIASGIADIGREAFGAVANYEQLGLALESMTARELLNAGAAETMADALKMAQPQAEALLGWVEQLAIQSPFGVDDVSSALKTAMAYGFTTDEAKRLTEAMLDFAAATGASGATMDRVSLALGQVRAKGKLTGGEVLQLTEAGFAVNDVLRDMGFTLDDVSKGLVSSEAFIEAFTTTVERDFGGAGERASETLDGLLNSAKDLKSIGLRNLFTGIFEPFREPLANLVAFLNTPETMEKLRTFGENIGGKIATALQQFGEAVQFVKNAFTGTNIGDLISSISSPEIRNGFYELRDAFDAVKAAFIENLPTLQELWGNFAGFVEETVSRFAPMFEKNFGAILTTISETWTRSAAFWNEHGAEIAAAVQLLLNGLVTIATSTMALFGGAITAALQLLNGDVSGALETIKGTFATIFDQILALAGTNRDDFIAVWRNNAEMFIKIGTFVVNQILQGLVDKWDMVKNWLLQKLAELANLVGFQFNPTAPTAPTAPAAPATPLLPGTKGSGTRYAPTNTMNQSASGFAEQTATIVVNIYAAVLDENAARRGATMGVQAALRARGAA